MDSLPEAPVRRTGPVQSDDVTHLIHRTVLDELADHGVGGLTIESVARRAGVGKATVYRRWTSKREMVLAVLTQVATRADLFPDTGELESDLRALFSNAAEHLRDPRVSRIVPDVLAESARDSDFAAALHEQIGLIRRHRAAEMIIRAIDRGELPAHVDLALASDMIAAPLYWRLSVTRQALTTTDLDRLVQMTINALRT